LLRWKETFEYEFYGKKKQTKQYVIRILQNESKSKVNSMYWMHS
jgi:hypothetical protein